MRDSRHDKGSNGLSTLLNMMLDVHLYGRDPDAVIDEYMARLDDPMYDARKACAAAGLPFPEMISDEERRAMMEAKRAPGDPAWPDQFPLNALVMFVGEEADGDPLKKSMRGSVTGYSRGGIIADFARNFPGEEYENCFDPDELVVIQTKEDASA